jgi:hypothetical protein
MKKQHDMWHSYRETSSQSMIFHASGTKTGFNRTISQQQGVKKRAAARL